MNIFMRIGYDLDVNSSHVESEFTTYKLRCFYQAYTSSEDNELSKIANSVPQNQLREVKWIQLELKMNLNCQEKKIS